MVAPPPTNTASGAGRPARAAGAAAGDHPDPGRARGPRRSGRSAPPAPDPARSPRPGSGDPSGTHSIATDPAPGADVPQQLAGRGGQPGQRGRPASRLVSCPSCSNASSGRPPTSASRPGRPRPSATMFSRDDPERRRHELLRPSRRSALSRRAQVRQHRQRRPPVSGRDQQGRDPGRGASRRPTAPAPAVRASAPAGAGRGSPDTRTTSNESDGQPSSAAASDTDDTVGCTRTRCAPTRSIRVAAIPNTSGSPDASTTTGRSPTDVEQCGQAFPQWTRAADGAAGRALSGTSAKLAGAADQHAGRAVISSCDRADRPAQPSAPIPTTSMTVVACRVLGSGRDGHGADYSPHRRAPATPGAGREGRTGARRLCHHRADGRDGIRCDSGAVPPL